MCKTRKHFKKTIELCRNCGGRGQVSYDVLYTASGPAGVSSVCCPICKGFGRVWKVNEGTVRIEPFTGQDRQQE